MQTGSTCILFQPRNMLHLCHKTPPGHLRHEYTLSEHAAVARLLDTWKNSIVHQPGPDLYRLAQVVG